MIRASSGQLRQLGRVAGALPVTLARICGGTIRSVGTALLLLAGAMAGLARVLLRPDRLQRRQVVAALARATILALPLVGVLAAVLGATVALAIANGFRVAPVEEVFLPVLRAALLRHTVPLVVGLLLVGQGGLGLATRLVGLQASGEADTLRSLGIAPAQWVLPASLLEFLVFGAAQFAVSAAIAQLAAALVFQADFGVPATRYAEFVAGPGGRADLWAGMARSEASALLVWLVAATTGVTIRPARDGAADHTARAAHATFVIALIGLLLIGYVFTEVGE